MKRTVINGTPRQNSINTTLNDFTIGIVERLPSAKIVPKINLNELKALVSKADLVIGGDSGPTHFAWALNRPSVTLFGPTPSERNILETSINKVLDCGEKIDPLKLDKKNYCIGNIESKRIVVLAKELLHD